MARRKLPNPLLAVAQAYLKRHMAEMNGATLKLRTLDGPPDAPRYVVTAEACQAGACPYDVPAPIAASGGCVVADCPLRWSVRLLLDRRGTVIHTTVSQIHWS